MYRMAVLVMCFSQNISCVLGLHQVIQLVSKPRLCQVRSWSRCRKKPRLHPLLAAARTLPLFVCCYSYLCSDYCHCWRSVYSEVDVTNQDYIQVYEYRRCHWFNCHCNQLHASSCNNFTAVVVSHVYRCKQTCDLNACWNSVILRIIWVSKICWSSWSLLYVDCLFVLSFYVVMLFRNYIEGTK